MIRRFSFPVEVQKSKCSVITKADGTREATIVAVASSDTLDSYWEYFAVSALNDMVSYARSRDSHKPEEGLVKLREFHQATFDIGTVTDGYMVTNSETKAVEFWIVIKLKLNFPAAVELLDDILAGVITKQLSVGGWIDYAASEDAYEVEWRKFISGDHDEVDLLVGRINRFILEHVAVTLQGFAANDDTRFVEALRKSLGSEQYQSYMTKTCGISNSDHEGVNNRISIVERATDLVKETVDLIRGLQLRSEEEIMLKPIEAAQALAKALVGCSAEEVEVIIKDSGLGILMKDTAVEETPEVAKEAEASADPVVVKEETPSPEVVEASAETDMDTKTADLLKSITDEIVVLKQRLAESETLAKTATDMQEFSTTATAVIADIVKRIGELEVISKVAKGETYEQGDDISRDKSLVETVKPVRKGLWV
jgi:hypothetical protein